MNTQDIAPSPTLPAGTDLQPAVDAAVSRATKNARRWDRETLHVAYKAARPVVEQDARSQGHTTTRDEVRGSVRTTVAAYAKKYGVVLPAKVVVGATPLEAAAADICGSFSMPWSSFLPPGFKNAVDVVKKTGSSPESWLKKVFGKRPAAPVAKAPAASPTTPATTAAPATSTSVAKSAVTGEVGSSDSLGSVTLGAWLHMLNPLYWFKSAEEKKLIDAEKQAWIDNAKLQKENSKKQEVLESGQKAVEARKAVEAARARAAEIEAQLKSIETQVSGACGSGACGSRACSVGDVQILGDDQKPNPYSDPIPPEDAAAVLKKVKRARELNGATKAELDSVCAKMRSGRPLSPTETSRVLVLLAQNEQAHEFRKAMVSGYAYSQSPSAKLIQKHVVVGAVKAMTPTEQGMLAQVMSMAKSGNRNAVKALKALRAQGLSATMGQAGLSAKVPGLPMTPAEQQKLAAVVALAKQGNTNAQAAVAKLVQQGYTVSMGSFVGWGIEDAFKLALKPVTIPLQYAWKGTKAAAQWTGRQLGITHGGTSPQQARIQRLKAAQARIRAAKARARAADAQSEAEYRAQQQLAAAADAEADAADAEATSKEAAIQTEEAQYLPGQTEEEAEAADAASSSMGAYSNAGVKPTITPLPATPATPPSAKDAELERLMKASYKSKKSLRAARRAIIAKHDPKAAKILAASSEKTPTGMKLQASMKLYVAAEKRGSRERRAVAVMVAKAKKGDKQALADVQALKLAGIAVKADRKAAKRVELIAKRRARAAKIVAVRKKAEVLAANQLTRASRAHKLAKVARLEKKAAAGNPKAKAFIAKHEALAKKGNKQSAEVVKAVALVRNVRTTTPNRREKRNLRLAHREVKKVARGNKKALRETRVIAAAAKHGNPNAKRAMKRLQTASALELTLKTGTVVVPAAALTGAMVAERKKKEAAAGRKSVASVEAKIANKTASREEIVAAARTASEQGDREKAAELLTAAAVAPSAGEELRRVATVAAAAEAGNPKTQANLERAQTLAAEGDPRGIEAMGKIAAVKNLSQVSKGRDLDPEMKEAVKDVEAAAAGSAPVAEKIASMQEKAAARDPAAVKYMVAATGAAIVSRALASNPKAQEEWKEKAGVVPATTENEDVPVGPPLLPGLASSLPDVPLPPVEGFLGLLKASVKALALATRDPFQNYREGVRSRGAGSPSVSTAGAAAPTSSLDAREVKVLEDALKSKTISKTDFEQLRKKEKFPGSALASLKSAGISVVPPGAATSSGGISEIVGAADEAKLAVHAKPEEDADWQKLVAQTKKRVGAVKDAASRGDAAAKKKWETAQANFVKNVDKANHGDANARTVVAVLAATGLFRK